MLVIFDSYPSSTASVGVFCQFCRKCFLAMLLSNCQYYTGSGCSFDCIAAAVAYIVVAAQFVASSVVWQAAASAVAWSADAPAVGQLASASAVA